ncbi:type-F conjugative transfer system pilin assembly protein TrbC [Escherichia coli]|nr:type-F conjugative transfer system pilin assembly protein TrbC [Escherichia coli]
MASINTIVKRKQYLWLGIVVVGTASAIGGALYLSDVDMSGNGETVAEQEPVPDMTGVVDTTFDDKVRQHATTEMQVTAAQMQKQYEEIRRELDVLNKQRGDDQRRIEKLGQDNAALAEQVKALGANPVTATGEPVPQMPASPPGPEGEPQPGNTPVSFPPQGSVAVPPPTAFYPGNGVTPPPQVTYQSVPVPNRIPATLRGMVNNDLKTTAEAVLSLVKDGATDGVQIDPTLFSQYGIRSVPALVVFCSQGYDIIRGNLRVGQALEKVAATGDCRQVAHDLLAGKGDSGK